MAFAVTCRNIRIENGELKASGRTVEQTFRESALDLVPLIGSEDGAFAIPGDAFIVNARDVRYDDSMCVLRASLKNKRGGWVEAALHLNLFVHNNDGVLQFLYPSEYLLNCACLHLEGTFLKALCLGPDGRLRPSRIDLGRLWTNRNGQFRDRDEHEDPPFHQTARNVRLQSSESGVWLEAQLRRDDGHFSHAEVSVCQRVVTRNGALQLADGNDVDRLGSNAADFFNGTNFIGSAIAGVLYAGKEGWGYPAITYLRDSPVFSTGLIVVGLLIGSTGNATAAALLDPLYATLTEALPHNEDGPQPGSLLSWSGDATLGRYMYQGLNELLAPGITADLGMYLCGISGVEFDTTLQAVMVGLGFSLGLAVSTELIDSSGAYAWINKLADALVNQELPPEWRLT